jgi:hypothetical protein
MWLCSLPATAISAGGLFRDYRGDIVATITVL